MNRITLLTLALLVAVFGQAWGDSFTISGYSDTALVISNRLNGAAGLPQARNYGADNTLTLDTYSVNPFRVFVRFETLPDSLPDNATVDSAQLKLTVFGSNLIQAGDSITIGLYAAKTPTDSIVEGTGTGLTGDSATSTNHWSCWSWSYAKTRAWSGTTTDTTMPRESYISIVGNGTNDGGTGEVHTWRPLAATVQSYATVAGNKGWIMIMDYDNGEPGEGQTQNYASDDNATTSYRPALTVWYQLAGNALQIGPVQLGPGAYGP